MDEHFFVRLEDAGTDIKDYEKVRTYVENRHVKNASRAAGMPMPRDSDKMVYGVEAAPAPQAPPTCAGGCGGFAIHPAPSGLGEPAAAAFDAWSDSQDPWACPSCALEAQEGLWQLDAFGKGKGKAKGDRGPMACYNGLGLGHPERLCASQYGAGKAQTGPTCKTCGGFGHDTPTCTSKGGAKFKPPPAKAKGKGKVQPTWGKGKGASQWGKGSYGKGKGKVSAFDDWPSQGGGAWDQWGTPPGDAQWPAAPPSEPRMQAAAAPP